MTALTDADREAGILQVFGRLDQVARRAGVYSFDPAVDLDDFVQTGAEAAVQAAWQYDPANSGGVPLSAWLWNAAKWAMIDHARRIGERRARIDQGRVARALLEDTDHSTGGFEPLAAVETHRLTGYATAAADHTTISGIRVMDIHAALTLLPDPVRAAVRLHCVSGLDRGVVAAMLHIPEAVVDDHVRAARRHLRATFRLRFRHDRRRATPTEPTGITVANATPQWAQQTNQRAHQIGTAAAAAEYGCSHMTLRRIWEAHGLPTPTRPKTTYSRHYNPATTRTREWAEQAFQLAAAHGVAEAAAQMGASRSGLYLAFEKYGLGNPRVRERSRAWTEQAFTFAREHGMAAAAEQLQVSRSALKRAFKKHRLGTITRPAQRTEEVAA